MMLDSAIGRIETYRYVTLFLLFLTASCSSSSSFPSPGMLDRSSKLQMQLSGIHAEVSEMANRYTNTPFTPEAMIPTIGLVSYNGFWVGVLANNQDEVTDVLTGELHVDISFADEEDISNGLVKGFRDSIGAPIGGTLLLENFRISRSEGGTETIKFSGAGNLTDEAGTVIGIEAQFGGNFLGEQAQGIAGEVTGHAEVGQEKQALGGTFIAEQ